MIRNGQEGTPPSFYGIFPAIATPFRDGSIDEKALRAHLQHLLEAKIAGIVPCGTTGESLALTLAEREKLIRICLEMCQGKALVVPGTGASTTAEALLYTRQAQELGADGVLVVSPYYVKADLGGILAYYKELHAQTHLPILLYSIPGRTGFELPISLIKTLATECLRICGIKDSSADLTRPLALRVLRPEFFFLSGEDGTFAASLAHGGDGIISVGANLVPHLYKMLHEAWQKGDLQTFESVRDALFPLSQVLFQAPSPGPLKYALSLMGYGTEEIRFPLGVLTEDHKREIKRVLEMLGLLS